VIDSAKLSNLLEMTPFFGQKISFRSKFVERTATGVEPTGLSVAVHITDYQQSSGISTSLTKRSGLNDV